MQPAQIQKAVLVVPVRMALMAMAFHAPTHKSVHLVPMAVILMLRVKTHLGVTTAFVTRGSREMGLYALTWTSVLQCGSVLTHTRFNTQF